jgi:hypothetical protein
MSSMRSKEIEQFFHGRGIHRVLEWNTLKKNGVNPNESANETGVHSEGNASDCGLQSKFALVILDHLHISIKILNQSGINGARAGVKIAPMVLPDQLIYEVERSNHDIGSHNISLNKHCLFSSLTLIASRTSSVLWWILRWKLLADIVLQLFKQIDVM